MMKQANKEKIYKLVIFLCGYSFVSSAQHFGSSQLKDQWEDITHEVTGDSVEIEQGEYSFAAFGKPDPFTPPPITHIIKTVALPITNLLQKFSLAQIQVAGIWTLENKQRKALLTTSSGQGVIVSEGDPIGPDGGTITRINPDSLVVRVTLETEDGEKTFSESELFLGGKKNSGDESTSVPSLNRALLPVPSTGADFSKELLPGVLATPVLPASEQVPKM